MSDAVRLDRVTFRYGPVPVFDRAALSIEPGSIAVVTGANGSGKSTLLKLILGLLSPEAGTIEALGAHPGAPHALRRIGYAPQGVGGAMVLPVSVSEVVAAGVTSRKPLFQPFGRLDWRQVNRALDAVGLDDLSRECVFELSGGQQQRALLARALVGDPELILLDEPTTGIDREFRTVLLAELRRRADHGAAVVAVSHDPEDFHDIVDRILALEAGKIRTLSHDEFHEVTGR